MLFPLPLPENVYEVGTEVSLYNPDPERNGVITGKIIGVGHTTRGWCYIVELNKRFQGYLFPLSEEDDSDGIYSQYISAIVVAMNSATPLS